MLEAIANHPVIFAGALYGVSILWFGALMLVVTAHNNQRFNPLMEKPWALKTIVGTYKQCLIFVLLCCIWPYFGVLLLIAKKRGL
jgi:hypothetical protein